MKTKNVPLKDFSSFSPSHSTCVQIRTQMPPGPFLSPLSSLLPPSRGFLPLPQLPFRLTLVTMVLSLVFQTYKKQNKKQQPVINFVLAVLFSRTTNSSKTFARPDDLRTSRKVSQESTAQGFFSTKKIKRRKKSILHSRASFFYTHLNNVKPLFLL